MNSIIKFILIAALFLIVLGSITLPFSSNTGNIPFSGKSYSIPQANVDLFVQDTGNINVVENLEFAFQGTYNGVYRDIPLKSGEGISNINVTTDGAFSKYYVQNISRNGKDYSHIVVNLYSNEQKTSPIKDRKVNVHITYDMTNVTKIYDDTAELHFKVWGEQWQVPVGQLNTKIHLASKEGVQYWFNPPYYVTNNSWEGSVLNVATSSIQPGNFFEVRLTMPKDQFTNPIYANQISGNGLSNIQNNQTSYQNGINIKQTIYYLITIILLIGALIPLFIYVKYGREPKPTYNGTYEREPPTDEPPAVINAVFASKSYIGEPGREGFQATVMDLLNRGYLYQEQEDTGGEKGSKSNILKVNPNKDRSDLHHFEENVMNFFGSSDLYDKLNLNQYGEGVSDQVVKSSFRTYYLNWNNALKNEYLNRIKIQKYFINEGNSKFFKFGITGMIVSAIAYLILFFQFDPIPTAFYAQISALILGFSAIVSLSLPETVGGRWTQYGRDSNEKWKAFKKYLKDFSLIQEYPPESVAIWNKYLVYATALGVATEVKKAMEKILPEEELYQSSTYRFHHSGAYDELSTIITSSMYQTSSSSGGSSGGGGGDSGGAGGGSGGGGGGAF